MPHVSTESGQDPTGMTDTIYIGIGCFLLISGLLQMAIPHRFVRKISDNASWISRIFYPTFTRRLYASPVFWRCNGVLLTLMGLLWLILAEEG